MAHDAEARVGCTAVFASVFGRVGDNAVSPGWLHDSATGPECRVQAFSHPYKRIFTDVYLVVLL